MKTIGGEGFDVWYAYEFRTLTKQGLPIAAALKFVIPHTSENIIESKSFKLYCNSFTTERLGKTKEEALIECCRIMKQDLSKAVKDNVSVSVITYKDKAQVYNDYVDLMSIIDPKTSVTVYHEDPRQLVLTNSNSQEVKTYKFKFDALRSKCRITQQPDSGTAYIYYKSSKHIDETSLVKYLSSFYEENHFHEEILITLFYRLQTLLNPEDELCTVALYQRRGSLDISPVHYKNCHLPDIDIFKREGIFAVDPYNIYR